LTRIQDLLPILVIVGAVAFLLPLDPAVVKQAQTILGTPVSVSHAHLVTTVRSLALIATLAGVAVFVAYRWGPAIAKILTAHVGGIAPRLTRRAIGMLDAFSQGMAVVGRRRYFWGAQALAFCCWAIFAVAPVPLLTAFGLPLRQACVTAVAKTGLTTIAHLLPSAPGAIGTYHVFCFVAVILCNPSMDANAAIAYSLLAHLVGTLSPALPGLVFLPRAWRGMRPLKVQPQTENSEPAPSEQCHE